MMAPLLEVNNLTKRFDRRLPPVVNDVSFAIEPGEIFALLGPSGCGKTTSLRMVAGLETVDSGRIRMGGVLLEGNGKPVPAENRGIGFVFQDYALFPHMTVNRNVGFGLRRLPRDERRRKVRRALDLVGLKASAEAMPFELSGGQQQRVALARALVAEPKLILLDEPFSNLDAVLRESTRVEVRNLLKSTGMTTLLVTHDQEEALSFADRLVVMNEGRIEQTGTPEEVYNRPRTAFVSRFLGRTNLIDGEAKGCMAETVLGRIRLDRTIWGRVLVSLRPEHLTLRPWDERANRPPGVIVGRAFKGHDITYRIRFPDREWLVHTDNRTQFQTGDRALLAALEPGVVLDDAPDSVALYASPEPAEIAAGA